MELKYLSYTNLITHGILYLHIVNYMIYYSKIKIILVSHFSAIRGIPCSVYFHVTR